MFICWNQNIPRRPTYQPSRKDSEELWRQPQRVRVVHVRGTPTSGKSMLGHLLKLHVSREEPGVRVYERSWPDAAIFQNEFNRNTYYGDTDYRAADYNSLLNFIVKRPLGIRHVDWLEMSNTLLIIDEAHMSYEYNNLWNDFLKRLASGMAGGPMVLLLSSYGSPAASPVPVLMDQLQLSFPMINESPSVLFLRTTPIFPYTLLAQNLMTSWFGSASIMANLDNPSYHHRSC